MKDSHARSGRVIGADQRPVAAVVGRIGGIGLVTAVTLVGPAVIGRRAVALLSPIGGIAVPVGRPVTRGGVAVRLGTGVTGPLISIGLGTAVRLGTGVTGTFVPIALGGAVRLRTGVTGALIPIGLAAAVGPVAPVVRLTALGHGRAAAGFPLLAKQNGARLVIVNREATDQERLADLVLHAEIGAVMAGAMSEMAA